MPIVTPNPAVAASLPISEANVTNLTTDLATLTTAANTIRVTSKNITSAQLKALDATPITLLAAPGGHVLYIVTAMALHYRFVTTAYSEDVRFALRVFYGSTIAGAGDLLVPLGQSGNGALFQQTADTYVVTPDIGSTDTLAADTMFAATAIENLPLKIGLTSPLTTGDGTLTVTTWYATVDGA